MDQNPQKDLYQELANYRIEMNARLETEAETYVNLPEVNKPYFPVYVEGKVECPLGETMDKTYEFTEDTKNAQNY